jgi:hypothetical protein
MKRYKGCPRHKKSREPMGEDMCPKCRNLIYAPLVSLSLAAKTNSNPGPKLGICSFMSWAEHKYAFNCPAKYLRERSKLYR